jgi:hypothetical protein
MKKLFLLLVVSILCLGCLETDSSNGRINQELREVGVDAGQPVSTEFQCGYSEYIWNDEPLVYIPNFGLTFDLTNASFIDFNSENLDDLSDLTVEFWFDPETTGTFNNFASVVFMACDTNGNTEGLAFHWHDQVQAFRLMACGVNGGVTVFTASELVAGSNHVVIQTSTSGFKVFLNGVLVEEVTMSYVPFDDKPFRIGANTIGQQNYIGTLDNFAIYNRELSTDEIIQHYAVGSDLLNR